ncbi:PAS domain S-box protein [Pleionea sp. CnH1-48]|uniref:sensor histidine kinase n=1 Tax=Pleionea sp. CnH1-48 TaxID=2954494 RepID=UPI0020971BC2|nr:PAS domain S-box protein [Pleionea sp. CnH1-48]MCO7223494.1 PAS domain S-box protein [Pleionea sp. CnH1-48]
MKDDAIILLDTKGRVLQQNAVADDCFGKALKNFNLISEFFHGSAKEKINQSFDKCLTTKEDIKIEVDYSSDSLVNISFNVLCNSADAVTILVVIHGLNNEYHHQELLSLIVEQAPNALIMTDEDGTIVLSNAQAESLFGYEEGELLGTSVHSLVPEDSRKIHPQMRKQFFDNPVPRAMGAGRDLKGQRKDGKAIPVEIGLNPIKIRDRQLVVASIVDVSHRQKEQDQLRLIIEQAPNALIMTDVSGIIVLANTQAENLFGYGPKELLGMSVDNLVPQKYRPEHSSVQKQFFEKPTTRAMGKGRDLNGVRKDGTEVPVEIGLNPIHTQSGMFVVASILDIRERLLIQKNLESLNSKLTQKNQEMEQFVYTVSHDLKSPLVTIGGFTKQLQQQLKDMLDDRQCHRFERISANVKHMEDLLLDLLNLSRIIRQDIEKVKADVKHLAMPVIHSIESMLEDAKVVVNFDDCVHPVLANERLLSQCLQNLLTNSIKYRDDSRPLVINVCTEDLGHEVVVKVIDNGMGIEEKYHDKIFRMFERLDIGEGTGVGLAIVKAIMEKHNGSVQLQSRYGEGSCFSLHFPSKSEELDNESS